MPPTRGSRTDRAVAVVLSSLVHVVVAPTGSFVVFIIAYGFADEITPALHVTFLLGLAMVAGVSTLGATALSLVAVPWQDALRTGGASALTLYALALGGGTVVSLLNEHQGSVTADQADWPFVGLVAGCVLLAGVGTLALGRVLRRP